MKIERFKARSLHGFLNLDIPFNRELTFLTGANGSGKSSALSCAMALIICDFQFLNDLDYEALELKIKVDGQRRLIKSIKKGRTISISFDNLAEFSFNSYLEDRSSPAYRSRELKQEYFSELTQINSSNETIAAILSLRAPLFLGIDRRARVYNSGSGPAYVSSNKRVVASRRLSEVGQENIDTAVEMAQQAYRDALITNGQYSQELRRKIILELISFKSRRLGELKNPTQGDLHDINRVLADVPSWLALLICPSPRLTKLSSLF